ncbi:MAG: FlhC family transcriptional regulator [Thermodesulfobacteriota bacterium]
MLEGRSNSELAIELVNAGMRLPLVHALTGLCSSRLRNLYKSVNGNSAPPGRTPEYAHLLIKNREQALEAAKFIIHYNLISKERGNGSSGCRVVDPEVLLKAYEFYEQITKAPLNINLACYIMRDLGSGRLTTRRCAKCGILYAFSHANEAMQTCPMC